jgi:xanthine dehydrogenase accessory factor
MSFYEKQLELIQNRIPFVLCTIIDRKGSVPAKPGSKMLVHGSGEIVGTIGGAELEWNVIQSAREMLAENLPPQIKDFTLFYKKEDGMDLACGGTVSVFIELVLPAPHLLICGGGHIGLSLSKIFDLLGYTYDLCDEREDFRSKNRFPKALKLSESLPSDPSRLNSYLCMIILTHSQENDYLNLLHLQKNHYQGPILLIGSKAKWKDFSKRLESDKVPQEFLKQIHCPAGLPMKTSSVPEIALSLAGWIADFYNQK